MLNQRRTSPTNILLVEEILEMFSHEWKVKITYIRRSFNGTTDTLAAMSRGQSIGEISFLEPPPDVPPQIVREQQGASQSAPSLSVNIWALHEEGSSFANQHIDPGG
ncbi:hypothetical protein V6N13_031103 [Hibiscus sabdariffa]|uniref:RNase H type-1 domain-containing protein n=1 Tax=Hibiscus sabdariffa TaxID=183260 RepID=A0ABR2CM39_9ROSI